MSFWSGLLARTFARQDAAEAQHEAAQAARSAAIHAAAGPVLGALDGGPYRGKEDMCWSSDTGEWTPRRTVLRRR